ncbi:hypothetical protein OG512_30400 [Streptomyces sp. NBC_01378]|uniref:hypothetical protein n=1 Tax=Streptomyces sp. NBC_01378 TaxID=2903844 RepID=UPI0032519887
MGDVSESDSIVFESLQGRPGFAEVVSHRLEDFIRGNAGNEAFQYFFRLLSHLHCCDSLGYCTIPLSPCFASLYSMLFEYLGMHLLETFDHSVVLAGDFQDGSDSFVCPPGLFQRLRVGNWIDQFAPCGWAEW